METAQCNNVQFVLKYSLLVHLKNLTMLALKTDMLNFIIDRQPLPPVVLACLVLIDGIPLPSFIIRLSNC